AGVASFLFYARYFVALLEVAKLIFQQDQFCVEEQILVLIVRGVIGDSRVPGRMFAGSASRCGPRARWTASAIAGLPGLPVQRVMEIDPESAVQFKNRQRTIL